MTAVIADFKIALEVDRSGSDEHDSRVNAFERAMDGIVRIECAIRSDGDGSAVPLDAFRRDVVALVGWNSRTMAYYVMNAHSRATSVMVDGWCDVSIRRSAMQFLLDNYPEIHDSLDEGDIELVFEIDDVLRDHADEVAPLPKDAIPAGIPGSHWWWWAPSASASYAEHVRQILE